MSDSIIVHGEACLRGTLQLSGAKNAALPLIVAACLGEEMTELQNMPVTLADVRLLIDLLKTAGAVIEVEGTTVRGCQGNLRPESIPAEIATRIRYSLLLLGLFAALRAGVQLPQPGGCQIGDRKYDLHLLGLRSMGADIAEGEGLIHLKPGRLRGANIDFYLPSTSGTENIMLAGCLAEGQTVLRNANLRPEVQQMGELLNLMGARITMDKRYLTIEGVPRLHGGVCFKVMPGWDEAVTYMIGAAMTGGELEICDINLAAIPEETRYLRECGVELIEGGRSVYVAGGKPRRPFDLFTAPYPGVNSDVQPLFSALALTADGTSTVTDLRFSGRFGYVAQLQLFGADIECFGNTALIRGGRPLHGARVVATDIRGGMACVMVALLASGRSEIANVYQIERGYERFVEKLGGLGAKIERMNEL